MSTPPAQKPTPGGRSRFAWELVEPALRGRLAAAGRVANDVAALTTRFGSPPRLDRFADVAPLLRTAWLPVADPRLVLNLGREIANLQRSPTPMTPDAAIDSLEGKRNTRHVVEPLRLAFLAAHQVSADGSARPWLPDRVQPNPASRLPTQVATWMHFNIGDDESDARSEGSGGQELYALKDTQYGERQLVWEGGAGGGIVGFVDFTGMPAARDRSGIFWDWGAFTRFERRFSVEDLSQEELLRERFAGRGRASLQGRPFRWSLEEGEAFGRLAADLGQPLPLVSPPVDLPDGDVHEWFGMRGLPAEARAELDVQRIRALWKKVGFKRQPTRQVRLTDGPAIDIPDLMGPAKGGGTLIVEVKRAVTATDGPEQLQRYLRRLDETRPEEGPWKGAFLHCHDSLNRAARDRISKLDRPIDVWGFDGDPDDGWKLVHVWRSA